MTKLNRPMRVIAVKNNTLRNLLTSFFCQHTQLNNYRMNFRGDVVFIPRNGAQRRNRAADSRIIRSVDDIVPSGRGLAE